jgi:hypothetical protein
MEEDQIVAVGLVSPLRASANSKNAMLSVNFLISLLKKQVRGIGKTWRNNTGRPADL